MSAASEIAAYKAGVNTDVTTKTAINSISPTEVGGVGTDLADLILPYLQTVENGGGAIFGETYAPTVEGSNGDLWYRINGTMFYLYRKEAGTWLTKVALAFAIELPDGPFNIRASIDGFDVTVTPGSWFIDNVMYTKGTQTGLTVPAADLNFGRYDLIYGNTSGVVGYLAGTAASTPSFPATPANSIVIDYVVVPPSSSGNDPYLFFSGSSAGAQVLGNGFYYFTNSDTPGISSNLSTGVITVTMASFPIIASNGIIRGNFDVRVGSDWVAVDQFPEVTKDGSGELLTAVFTLNQSFDEIRGRIF